MVRDGEKSWTRRWILENGLALYIYAMVFSSRKVAYTLIEPGLQAQLD